MLIIKTWDSIHGEKPQKGEQGEKTSRESEEIHKEVKQNITKEVKWSNF